MCKNLHLFSRQPDNRGAVSWLCHSFHILFTIAARLFAFYLLEQLPGKPGDWFVVFSCGRKENQATIVSHGKTEEKTEENSSEVSFWGTLEVCM